MKLQQGINKIYHPFTSRRLPPPPSLTAQYFYDAGQ